MPKEVNNTPPAGEQRKELSSAAHTESGPQKKRVRVRKICSADGCTKYAQQGGLCIRHGAKVKLCSSEGCPNKAKKGGVCVKHGAKQVRKRCSVINCTNQVIKGGVCTRHRDFSPQANLLRGRVQNEGNRNNTSPLEVIGDDEGQSQTTSRKRKADVITMPKEVANTPPAGKKKRSESLSDADTEGGPLKKRVRVRKLCASTGCTKYAQQGGVCIRHGAKVKLCSSDGCTNQAKKGGVCVKHGARKERKLCSSDGGTNLVQNGGRLIIMPKEVANKPPAGEKRKESSSAADAEGSPQKKRVKKKNRHYECNVEGCTKYALKGGVCVRHGAKVKVKLCSSEGCTNQAKKGGLCLRHGGKVKLCSSDGCPNQAKKGGVCKRHGARKEGKLCSSDGCTNLVQNRGRLVITPKEVANTPPAGEQRKELSRDADTGDGPQKKRVKVRKLCTSEGCTKYAQQGGLCMRHGAKVKLCSSVGCTNQAKKGGVCITHGARKERKRCSVINCTNKVVKGGVCYRHRNVSPKPSTGDSD